MDCEETAVEAPQKKQNRRRALENDRARPVVHGIVPYFGHRPDPKHERRREAQIVQQARRQSS
jgi:hypothetical protein